MTGQVAATRAPVRIPPETRPVPSGAWADWLVLFLLVALTVGLAAETPLVAMDVAVRDWADAHRPPVVALIVRAFNYLGQGLPLTLLCLGLAVLHARRLRSYEPVLPVVCAFVLSYVSIGAIKLLTDRGAPHYGSVLLFSESTGRSYPSGHAANVVVWYGLLTMLLAPFVWPWLCRLLRYGPLIVVSVATTYLGYHWVTDTIAGLFVGVLIDRAVRRSPWRRWPWLMSRLRRPRSPGLVQPGAG